MALLAALSMLGAAAGLAHRAGRRPRAWSAGAVMALAMLDQGVTGVLPAVFWAAPLLVVAPFAAAGGEPVGGRLHRAASAVLMALASVLMSAHDGSTASDAGHGHAADPLILSAGALLSYLLLAAVALRSAHGVGPVGWAPRADWLLMTVSCAGMLLLAVV